MAVDGISTATPNDEYGIIKALGGATKLAPLLGASRSAVSNWPLAGIPARYWPKIARIASLDPTTEHITVEFLERLRSRILVDQPVLTQMREGAVLRAVLNRPERRNALNGALFTALEGLIAACAADRTLRVVVLSGAGGHFCAGLDLTELAEGEAALIRNRRMGAILAGLSGLPQVVVAEVSGAAHAGGLGLACAADLVFASADARFAAPETRRGLVAAQILPWIARRVGRSEAARLVLQAPVIGAAEAARIGLVHGVEEEAGALVAAAVADLLQGAPGALAETKLLLAALGPVVPAGYAEAGALSFSRCAAGPEAAEGIAAFREKRAPNWAA